MSKLIIFILSPLLLIYPRYENIFSTGYDDAIQFIKDNKQVINHVFNESDEEKTISLSVVFPEVVRYSYLIDYFQKSAMETIYIKYGKEKANFSIGRFQMKPSFIEELEQYVQRNPDVKNQFKYILNYPSSDITKQRKTRIKRLNSFQWQLNYLKCFYSIMDHRFSDITWNNRSEKIEFYATAYNHDFTAKKEDIKKWTNKKTFPYGIESNAKQYAYSNISVYFYKKHWPSLKNDMTQKNKKKQKNHVTAN